MRYLVASDIHGSATGAKIIAEKFKKLKCNKILLLGDILYHGPRNPFPDGYSPKDVCDILNPLAENIIAVKGNCDAEVDQMVLDFKLNDAVSLELEGKTIFCTHGQNISEEMPAKFAEGTVVLYGHYHKVRSSKIDGTTYINVGSIALPKEQSPKCYGVLDGIGIKIYDINDNLFAEYKF